MADIIRIKRSDVTAAPTSLAAGEIAYSEVSGNLFYGRISDGAPVVVAGKTAIDKLATIESGAQVNTITSVAGRTGAVVITSSDIADLVATIESGISSAVLNDLNNVSVVSPSNDQVLTYNESTGNWEAKATPSGVTSFSALNDTPSSYSGQAGRFVKVNTAANALEYIDGIDGGTF